LTLLNILFGGVEGQSGKGENNKKIREIHLRPGQKPKKKDQRLQTTKLIKKTSKSSL